MHLKVLRPSAEEQEFCNQVNALLRDCGAKVSAYNLEQSDSVSYHMLFEMGSKRMSVQLDQPWHYDAPQEVVARVLDWIDHTRQATRWTTELPEDLDG